MKKSTSIAGTLDWGALYGQRDQHRPQTREQMRVAVYELRSRGYTDHEIAAATRLSVEQVRRMLGESRDGR